MRQRRTVTLLGLLLVGTLAACAGLAEDPPEVDCEAREVHEEIAAECMPASRSLLER